MIHLEDEDIQCLLQDDSPHPLKGRLENELAGTILQKLNVQCDQCVQCLTSSESNMPGLDESVVHRKCSDQFLNFIRTARATFDQKIVPEIHYSGIKHIALQHVLSVVDTTWLTCSVHGCTIADAIIRSVVRILILQYCKNMNRESAKVERRSANAAKIAQQAGLLAKCVLLELPYLLRILHFCTLPSLCTSILILIPLFVNNNNKE